MEPMKYGSNKPFAILFSNQASETFRNESNRDTYIGHYSINFAQMHSDITCIQKQPNQGE